MTTIYTVKNSYKNGETIVMFVSLNLEEAKNYMNTERNPNVISKEISTEVLKLDKTVSVRVSDRNEILEAYNELLNKNMSEDGCDAVNKLGKSLRKGFRID